MKRYGNLYGRVCSYENLQLAYEMASQGKKKRPEVQKFCANLETNIKQIHEELTSRTYATSPYEVFIKCEPKRREIYKLPFRDRVVHWAIMLVIEPIWIATFTSDTYACVKGRGIHKCFDNLKRDLLRDPEGTTYCLKLDVRKFYPTIDHEILKQVVRCKIKDKELLWLLDEIIDSADGVPIGNYLSQFFANLYLSEFDHVIKEQLGVKYYYRYADDIVVLAADKEELSGILIAINHYLNDARQLEIKSNYQIFPVESRGIDFVGYVSRHTHTLLRKSIKKNFCRAVTSLNKQENITEKEYKQKVCSWLGWAKHCNSKHLINTIGMKKFSEVQKARGNFEGSKLRLDEILDKTIQLTGFTVTESRYHDRCLTIQFMVNEPVTGADNTVTNEWVQHICFTGSEALIKQLEGVDIDPEDPPFAKIIKQSLTGGRCFYKIVDPD